MFKVSDIRNAHKHSLLVAFTVALALHALLFAIVRLDLTFRALLKQQPPINIQISKPQLKPQQLEPIEEPVNDEKVTPSAAKPIESPPPVVAKPPPEAAQEVLPIVVFNGAAVQQWLQRETEQHISKNPQALQEFERSFVPIVVEKPADDRLEDFSSLATGVYTATINGKRVCQLTMKSIFQDDWSGDVNTSRDCSPPEKFEFKMR